MSVRARLQRSGPYVLGGSILVLEQFTKVAELIPSPFVKPAVELALGILKVVQTMRENAETSQTIVTQLGRLMLVVLKPWVTRAEDVIPAELRDSLRELERRLQEILLILEKINKTPTWKAVFRTRDHTAKLAECQQLMDQAVTFFQVDALIEGALKLDSVDRKVDNVDRKIDKVLQAVATTTTIEYPSADLPSKPDALFGREEYIDDLVGRLCYNGAPDESWPADSTPPRLAILGPGGIGKTTVALAAVSDRRVKSTYDDRIHWVPCEEATSSELLVELIARSLGVPKGGGTDRKRDVIDFLRKSSTQPRLLLLDNFETPWDIPERQMDVDNILFDIANASPLAILLTMRSDLPPSTRMRWTKPTLPPLSALSLSAARELYLDIHEDAGSDPSLDLLLHELAYMPLAVRLMANRGRWGEMPGGLLKSWKDERLRIKLLHQGDNRIASVIVSVELSINSNLMRQNPDALVLLSVLAELPAGARREFIQDIAPSVIDPNGALGTLRQAALVQAHPSTQHIQLLSPVRSMVLEKYCASPDLRTSLRQAYFDLIRNYGSSPGDTVFLEAVDVLGVEAVNIETVLLNAMADGPSDACIGAAYDYANFQYHTTPRAEILETAVSVVRDWNSDPLLLSRGLHLEAKLYLLLARYIDAMEAGKEAVAICKRTGEQLGEANGLKELCNTYISLARYSDALKAGEESRNIYKRIGDELGEANSLQRIGSTYQALEQHRDAVDAMNETLETYRKIGEPLGEAGSLRLLADSYRRLGRYDDAEDAAKQAMVTYKRIGSVIGEADCLGILGKTFQNLGQYENAADVTKQALLICKRVGDPLGEANCLENLGLAYQSLSLHEEAVKVAQEGMEIFQRIGMEGDVARCRDLLQELGVDSV